MPVAPGVCCWVQVTLSSWLSMAMEPIVRAAPRLHLAGVSFFGNPFLPAQGSAIDRLELLWRRYRRTVAAVAGFPSLLLDAGVAYELHVYGEETASNGNLEVFAGQPVQEDANVPHQMCVKTVGEALYAVLQLHGEDTTLDWRGWIDREWLPGSGYRTVGTHDVLLFRLQPSGERVALEAWVPVGGRL
jgi:predicted transcriptional regulator YdeE